MRRRWFDWLELGGVVQFLNLSYNNSIERKIAGRQFILLHVKFPRDI